MKWLFVFVIAVHGLIHLMGFTKAFGLAEAAQLREHISRPLGVLWLVAALLFLVSATLLLAAPSWWWVPAAAAVLVSQAVILTSWRDARFGTIANVIVLVPLVITLLSHGESSFRSIYQREAARGLQRFATTAPVLEVDLAHLPLPVQKYLRQAGVVGRSRVHNFRARFRGEIKNKPNAGWMAFTARQHTFFDEPTRLFLIESALFGIPFDGLHVYVGPSATMQVKVASLLTVVDAKGPEMNRGETVTLFNDMCVLAPATLIDKSILWEALGSLSAKATFTNAGNTISAVLSFNDQGELINFFSDDRYQSADGKTYKLFRWSTPMRDYRSFGGVRVASRGDAIWHMPEGDLTYGRFELVELEYNVTGAAAQPLQ